MDSYRKQGYLLEKFRLFHLSSPGGARTEFHYHEFCKILLLLSGSGGYVIDGARYLLRPGDVVLVRDGSIHRPELDGDVAYQRVILYIDPNFLAAASTEDCDLRAIFDGHVLRPGEKGQRVLAELTRVLEQELAGESVGREIASTAALLRLLVEIARLQSRGTGLTAEDTPRDSRVEAILGYLDNHLAEELDIDSIARRFFLSRYHMMRLFRQETGTTIHLYITQKRLLMARELIHGGMKATQACYQSGFRSYSSFTRAAQKYLGSTPTGRPGQQPWEEELLE